MTNLPEYRFCKDCPHFNYDLQSNMQPAMIENNIQLGSCRAQLPVPAISEIVRYNNFPVVAENAWCTPGRKLMQELSSATWMINLWST